jgi:uncharacterized membrane protein (UPF0127 family)
MGRIVLSTAERVDLATNSDRKSEMSLRNWNLVRWFYGLRQPKPPANHKCIVNVTRQTLLADALEVADCGPRRRKGLLGRKCLSPGEGLWIIPCEAVHTFGMQFPIDVVFLDRKNQVVKTRSNVRPGRLSACLSARSVVELPWGTVLSTQTKRGDKVEFHSQPANAVDEGLTSETSNLIN